jgi:bla regulator protein blaR1
VDDLLNWLWQGSVVALATFALLRLLDRSRAGSRYGLCSLALLTVLMLPAVSFVSLLPSTIAAALETTPSSASLVPVPTAWWTSTEMLAILWALWCAASFVRLAAAVGAVRRARHTAQPLPPALESRLTFWTRVRGTARRTRLVISGEVPSAAVLGWGPPTIAISPAFIERLDDEAIDRVIVHEWAHVQRRDDLLNLLQIAIVAVAGWHPAVWWLERQMRIEREAACDEMAVRVTGSPKRYAASLTAMVELIPPRHRPVSALGAFSSPALSARVPRILSIDTLRTARWSGSRALAAALMLCVLAIGLAQVKVFAQSVVQTVASVMQPVLKTQPRLARMAPPAIAQDTHGDRSKRGPQQQKATTRPEPDVPSVPILPVESALPLPLPVPLLERAPQEPQPTSTATVVAASPPQQPPSPPRATVPPDDATTPWGAAADAGTAIGRGSRNAGVATGSFFSRLGKKIGGSF